MLVDPAHFDATLIASGHVAMWTCTTRTRTTGIRVEPKVLAFCPKCVESRSVHREKLAVKRRATGACGTWGSFLTSKHQTEKLVHHYAI